MTEYLRRPLIYGIDYYVYPVKLPPHVGGAVYPEDDGAYTIYINSSLCPEKQQDALVHELRHISLGHYDRTREDVPTAAKELEAEAPGGAHSQF